MVDSIKPYISYHFKRHVQVSTVFNLEILLLLFLPLYWRCSPVCVCVCVSWSPPWFHNSTFFRCGVISVT
jgi:hypothetical protein